MKPALVSVKSDLLVLLQVPPESPAPAAPEYRATACIRAGTEVPPHSSPGGDDSAFRLPSSICTATT
jgi:hypothetical protein